MEVGESTGKPTMMIMVSPPATIDLHLGREGFNSIDLRRRLPGRDYGGHLIPTNSPVGHCPQKLTPGLALETAFHFPRFGHVGDLGDQRLAFRL